MLTEDDKRRLYRAGDYLMPVPGPCPVGWSEAAWIRFIDIHGKWVIKPAATQ